MTTKTIMTCDLCGKDDKSCGVSRIRFKCGGNDENKYDYETIDLCYDCVKSLDTTAKHIADKLGLKSDDVKRTMFMILLLNNRR